TDSTPSHQTARLASFALRSTSGVRLLACRGLSALSLLQSTLMFVGLEHTAIASPSPATLAQWYVDHLNFRINFEYDGNFFVRAANGAMLEIIPSEGARADQKMRDPGLRHLAVEVSDFDAAHAALEAGG